MKPRLTCRLARTWSALRDNASSAHLASCPDCQAFLARTSSLDSTLRHHARAARPTAPADLDRRILEAVAHARAPQREPSRSRSWFPLATLGGAAAAVALTVTVLQRPAREPLALRADADALVATVSDLSTRLVDNVIPSAGTMIADNPMQNELGAVYTDAKTALDFLALNFMPNATAQNNPPAFPRRSNG